MWLFFERCEESPSAKCTICGKLLALRGGTSNLRDHLTKLHGSTYEKAVKGSGHKGKETSGETLDAFVRTKSCSATGSREITHKIATMIVVDMRPIRMVECAGFKSLLSFLEPGYTVPSHQSASDMISLRHRQGKQKLINELAKASSVALTTDMWTSITMDAYMTVTAHYVSKHREMVSCVLETSHFPERHTGQNIAEKLFEVTNEYKIQTKISAVVHDQASNIELAMRILEDQGWLN